MLTETLKRCASLRFVGPQRIRAAVEFFEARTWLPGQTVMSQGDTDYRHFYIVGSGAFDTYRKEAGTRAPVGSLTVGDLFGELSLLHNVPRSGTVRCAAARRRPHARRPPLLASH